MATNQYFDFFNRSSEQNLVEDLIIESLQIYGYDLYYIPRTLVARDNVFNEDRLSEFRNAYPIEMYIENVDGYDGQGEFVQKFGLQIEKSASFVVAKKRWDQVVGSTGTTILPNRPAEGDLLYYPLSKSLFEIRYVEHQEPFYQLGKFYTYKLRAELFQYSSEPLDTGVAAIDNIELNQTFDLIEKPSLNIEQQSKFAQNNKLDQAADSGNVINFDEQNPFGEIQ